MDKLEFETVLLSTSDNVNASYIEIPFDVEKVFGKKGQVKVKITFDGVLYRGTLAPMGGPGKHVIIVIKAIRDAINKKPGDTTKVTMVEDAEERIVEIPDYFKKLLEEAGIFEKFIQSSYTNRKEFIRWIESAKRPETKEKRIKKAIEKISKGIRFS